jgi:hypothetical protein
LPYFISFNFYFYFFIKRLIYFGATGAVGSFSGLWASLVTGSLILSIFTIKVLKTLSESCKSLFIGVTESGGALKYVSK